MTVIRIKMRQKAGKSYNTSDTHSSGDENRNKDKEKNVFDDMKDETAGGDIAVSEAGSIKRSGHESYGDAQRTAEPVEKENEAGAGKVSDKNKVGQTECAECVGNAEKSPSEVKKAENATSVIVNKVNGETGVNSDGKYQKTAGYHFCKEEPWHNSLSEKRIHSLTDKIKSIIKKTKRKIRAVIRSRISLRKRLMILR